MSFNARLQAIWYGREVAPMWLRLLTPVYRGLRALARLPYRFGLRTARRLPVPVIVVGNLTAGGSGKTPLVLALIAALRERGWNCGVISRGYGGSASTPTRVGADSKPASVGDEPYLIWHRSGAPVAIARKRTEAALLLLSDSNRTSPDVLIADDGLQHLALARDIDICVIDGQRRFGNGRLLPAGPLREPLTRLAEIEFRICNGGVPHDGEIEMDLRMDGVVSLVSDSQWRSLASFAGERIHAVAAIGNPERFFQKLRDAGIEIVPHSFPDHHAFKSSDLDFGDELLVLMTEKDAVKCRDFATHRLHAVIVSAQLPPTFFDAIALRLKVIQGNHSRQ